PVLSGGKVKPGEAVRLVATGIISVFGATGFVNFVIKNSAGQEVFRRNSIYGVNGTAFIDTVAPMEVGRYTFTADAQSFPVLGITHPAGIEFVVDPNAPEPPDQPPGWFNFFKNPGNIKMLVLIGAGVIGLVAVAGTVQSLRK
ncbi:MAG: hypothetical protein Q7N50_08035, partial [Armatimonadota bacterium]|nr:hypothetical protein [Armatimonadota bacterium]